MHEVKQTFDFFEAARHALESSDPDKGLLDSLARAVFDQEVLPFERIFGGVEVSHESLTYITGWLSSFQQQIGRTLDTAAIKKFRQLSLEHSQMSCPSMKVRHQYA